mmetsp:Transcript_24048/g.66812  ORF Transcript_24048/g.66812 Transcript_24048/m.66812 type:complete len:156 (+) Transcript_24048:157-624(+)
MPGTETSGSNNGATFSLENEDHTLANALRYMLNKSLHVEFAGYSIPHPSEKVVNVRVQTTGGRPNTAILPHPAGLPDACFLPTPVDWWRQGRRRRMTRSGRRSGRLQSSAFTYMQHLRKPWRTTHPDQLMTWKKSSHRQSGWQQRPNVISRPRQQ